MTRSLLPFFLVGCAQLPEIRPCDPTGTAIDAIYINLGNDDLMVASMRYVGCPRYDFQLCGVGSPWLTKEGATLSIWHDDSMLECDIENQEDQLFNLRSLRRRYETDYDVESADLLLTIGSHELEYSFQADK